jgi:hypothetical protein
MEIHLAAVPMNEPIPVPNVEAVPDTRDINTVSVFDGRFVGFVHHL